MPFAALGRARKRTETCDVHKEIITKDSNTQQDRPTGRQTHAWQGKKHRQGKFATGRTRRNLQSFQDAWLVASEHHEDASTEVLFHDYWLNFATEKGMRRLKQPNSSLGKSKSKEAACLDHGSSSRPPWRPMQRSPGRPLAWRRPRRRRGPRALQKPSLWSVPVLSLETCFFRPRRA